MGPGNGGALYRIYRNRVGEPTTADEVRGYWVFLVGLVLGTLGFVLFLPSQSAVGTSGLTLRELSIFLTAVGTAMLLAGAAIRLPLKAWANYMAYLGQAVAFIAAAWFVVIFPGDWAVQTGNQPVIILYAVGIAIIAFGGVIVPSIVGATREELDASEARAGALERETESLRAERDRLEQELATARKETAASEGMQADLEADADRLQTELDEREALLETLYASQAQFELFADSAGEYRWRLRHRNGNVIADSSEGYTRRHNAQKGMQSVRRNALGADVLQIEPEPDEDVETALAEAPVLVDVTDESRATFELEEDTAGEYRWRLRHDNGNILGDGAEGYASRSNARRAIDRVREYVGPADYLWFDPTGFEVYRDQAGEWRWRLVHKNGNILADSGESYTRRNDANRAVDRIRDRVDELEFEVYEDNAGEYRWRLRGGNDQVLGDSGEGYDSRSGAEEAVDRVREYAPDADVLDIGRASFEIYEDRGGDHRWRLRHRNGNILMDSGEGYADRSGARDGVESVKRNAPNADIEA